MRISLELRDLAEVITGLGQVTEAFDRVAEARDRVTSGKVSPTLVSQIDDAGRAQGDFLGRQTLSGATSTIRPTRLSSDPTLPMRAGTDLTGLLRELIEVDRKGFADLVVSGGGRGGNNGLRSRGATGGLANLQQRQDELQQALGSGDATRIRDARVRALQAQRRVDREDRMLAGGPSFGQRLLELIGTSRIGLPAGGGMQVSPLANRIGRLFGDSGGANGAAGPAGVALTVFLATIAAATAATKLFADTIKDAAVRGQESARAATVTGGSAADVARFGAFGLTANQGANLSQQIFQSATSGPMGRSAMAQLGLPQVSASPFANTNRAQVSSEVLAALERETNLNKQLRIARMLGIEGMLDELRVSDSVRQSRRQEADERRRIFDPEFLQKSRDFNAQLAIMGRSFEDMLASFAGPLLGDAKTFAQFMGEAFRQNIPIVHELGKQVHEMFNFMMEMALRVAAVAQNPLDPQRAGQVGDAAVGRFRRWQQQNTHPSPIMGNGGSGRQNPLDWQAVNGADFGNKPTAGSSASAAASTAAAANIRALAANTDALNGLRGEFGGSSRTRGAIASAFLSSDPGDPRRKLMELQAYQLGFWGTGAV